MANANYAKVISEVPGKFITKDAFKAYLKKHLNKTFQCRDPFKCPLAVASGYVIEPLTYTVGITNFLVMPTDKTLPPWARAFITKVDSIDELFTTGQITGQRCLELLK